MRSDQARLKRVELKERLYRQRYVVPNLVTVGSLFCGMLAIIYASSGRLEKAVIAVMISMVLDGLDGRVARRLNATSKFGVEFDSFADLVAFGVAPAIVIYNWCYRIFADEFGVFVCFVYLMCAASRLARFNITESNLKGFEGLPTPAAAGMLIVLVHLYPQVTANTSLIILVTIMMGTLAFLMVSKIEFVSIKVLKIKDLRSFIALGALVALIWYQPKVGLLSLLSLYVLSGPMNLLYTNWRNRKRIRKGAASEFEKLAS